MTDLRSQDQPDDAMVDLLIKQVTEGLSPDEQRALDVLDTAVASAYARDLERAAAAVTLAVAGAEPLPPTLAQRLANQAAAHFSAAPVSASPVGAAPVVDMGTVRDSRAAQASQRPFKSQGAYGWLAAAACLVLAVVGWMRTPALNMPVPVASVTIAPPKVAEPPAPRKPPSAAQERDALLAQADALKIHLNPTKDPAAAGVAADVVWDEAAQRGFLHLTGLARNDPAAHQYQLWIFDASRDKRYPVDGGVFDIPADGSDIVIPIRAAIMVQKPAAFAVTLEKAGGVVVSGREHVVALGAVS